MKKTRKKKKIILLNWMEIQYKNIIVFFLNRYYKIENGFNIVNR